MEATLSARTGQKLSKLSLSIDKLLLDSSNNPNQTTNSALPHLSKLKSDDFSTLRIRLAQDNFHEPVTWDEVNEALVESFDYRTISPDKIELKGLNGISEIMTVLWASLVLEGVEYDVLQGWADRLNLAINKILYTQSSKASSQKSNGFVLSSAPSPEVLIKHASSSATNSPTISIPRTRTISSSSPSPSYNASSVPSRGSGSSSNTTATSGTFARNSSSPPKPILSFMSEKAMGKRKQEEVEPYDTSTKKVRSEVQETPHTTRSVSMQVAQEPSTAAVGRSVEPPHITRSVSTQLIGGSSGPDGSVESTQASSALPRSILPTSPPSDIDPSTLSLADYTKLALPIPSNVDLSTLAAFPGRDLNTTDLKFTREEICWRDNKILSEGLIKKKDNSNSSLQTFDYSRKHLHLFPSKNILPRSTGDPFVFFSTKQDLKLFRDLSPWNVFLTNEEGKDWIYIGTYKVILATKTSSLSMKNMTSQRRQILRKLLLGHCGNSMNGSVGGKEARALFEEWGFSSLSVNGSLDELDQGLGAGINFAIAKCVGFDEVNFKIWDKRRKAEKK